MKKQAAERAAKQAAKQTILTEVSADFQELKKVLASNDEFMALLNAPKISADRKKELIVR